MLQKSLILVLSYLFACDTLAIQTQIIQAQCRAQCTKETCKTKKQYDYCKQICDPKIIVDCMNVGGDAPENTHMSPLINDSIKNMKRMQAILKDRMILLGLESNPQKRPQKTSVKQKRTESETDIIVRFNNMQELVKQNPNANGKDYANQLAKSLIDLNFRTCEYAHQEINDYIEELPAIKSNTISELKSVPKEHSGFLVYVKSELLSSEHHQKGMLSAQEENDLKSKSIGIKLKKLHAIGPEYSQLVTKLELKCKIAKDQESEDMLGRDYWVPFMAESFILPEAADINQIWSQAEQLHTTSLKHWNMF